MTILSFQAVKEIKKKKQKKKHCSKGNSSAKNKLQRIFEHVRLAKIQIDMRILADQNLNWAYFG